MGMYNKPKSLSYTDICIWIDNNAYADSCDDEKLFEYLYYLTGMLAWKRKFLLFLLLLEFL